MFAPVAEVGLNAPDGVAISGNDLYIANYGADTVGEYSISGSTVNASLISGNGGYPVSIAVSGNDLFVGRSTIIGCSYIGEYTVSGAAVSTSLISGLNYPAGIAIAPVPEPSAGALAGLGAVAMWLWRRRK